MRGCGAQCRNQCKIISRESGSVRFSRLASRSRPTDNSSRSGRSGVQAMRSKGKRCSFVNFIACYKAGAKVAKFTVLTEGAEKSPVAPRWNYGGNLRALREINDIFTYIHESKINV